MTIFSVLQAVEFETFMRRVGKRVRLGRHAAGLTQEELAHGTVTYRLLGLLERGEGRPTLETLFRISEKLGLSISDLVDVQPKAGRVPLNDRKLNPPKPGRKPKKKRRAKR